jgi:hypothetical protein
MRLGAFVACIAVALVAAVPQIAIAQEDPRPVMEYAPAEVQYRGSAVVKGRMANGSGGEQITLQKLKGDQWNDLETREVNDEGRVEFHLDGLTRTAEYRLFWKRPDGDGVVGDGRAPIRVAAKVTLEVAKHHVMSGRRVRLNGYVLDEASGREVALQQKVDGAWRLITRKQVVDGHFSHEFRVRSKGYRSVRAIFRGDDANSAGRATDHVKVYSRSYATWYGPGLYGNRTACGGRLKRDTLGVAHRNLACGTDVSILYKGRTITVPVIDRGPYAHGADWDLTEATARRLRFQSSDTIGTTR